MECKAGINHIEYWVSDAEISKAFYDSLYGLIGWRSLGELAYSSGSTEIYYIEKPGLGRSDTIGPRHICFQATDRMMVDRVGDWLKASGGTIIRGPKEMEHYSQGYYTIDFRDPDGYVIEVAYTPHMQL